MPLLQVLCLAMVMAASYKEAIIRDVNESEE